jgi:23S rRNA (cytosine1962-C5)-methyltransferase
MEIKLNQYWSQYELVDCGNGKKLERFGEVLLIRPEVSAINTPEKPYNEWKTKADAEFFEDTGQWKLFGKSLNNWVLPYGFVDDSLDFNLKLTNFKHVGIFPEQVINWLYIQKIANFFTEVPRFLNLFGYTGASSLIAARNGYKVTHVEALKQIIQWGKTQAESNGTTCIRWLNDDVVKFVEREKRRGNTYHVIMLDPPATGKGPGREHWQFEKDIQGLLLSIKEILAPKAVLIMNFYAHSMNEKFGHKMILEYFKDFKIETCDAIDGSSKSGKTINHGYLIRLERGLK